MISQTSGPTYAIEYTSDGDVLHFTARLGSLEGRSVLDVWPTPRGGQSANRYAGLMAGHLLLVVDLGSEEMRVAALEPNALLATLGSGALPLAFRRSDDRVVLYGTTEQLRAAIGSYLAKPGALSEPEVWRRSSNANRAGPVAVPCFEASSWPEADQLFHGDPHWVGGDGASSVDLGDGRILWLFGDSWIDPSGRGTRQGARMVSNSVAIQRGTDPVKASVQFYWGRAPDGRPAAFVPDAGEERHWFGNGVRMGDRLVLFFNRVRSSSSGLGFESTGWSAWIVENPESGALPATAPGSRSRAHDSRHLTGAPNGPLQPTSGGCSRLFRESVTAFAAERHDVSRPGKTCPFEDH